MSTVEPGDLTITFTVDQTPHEAFEAINNVRGWWTGDIEGETDFLGAEFTYRHEDIHRSTQRVTEFIPGRRVVWHVVEAYLEFTRDSAEWTGTDVTFDISTEAGRTTVRFTHVGLTPRVECFDSCSDAWCYYINGGLRNLIAAMD
jgi:hypothetical protein